MDAASAFRILREAAAEVVTEAELQALCTRAAQGGKRPRAYVGFEPSGTAHIGWMVCTDMVRRLDAAGFEVEVLLADWHAQINDKLGGDLAAIQRCGAYMEEAFRALGVPASVRFRYASQAAADPSYWAMVVQVSKHTSLARMRRAMTILGRGEDEADADMSKFLYPAMQVADIFHMGIDLAYGGMDQRHAHMLARDVAGKLGRTPPLAIHTPLVPSLKGPGAGRMEAIEGAGGAGQKGSPKAQAAAAANQAFVGFLQAELARGMPEAEAMVEAQRKYAERQVIEGKMSKSDPDSGIFIHDTPEEIRRKLKAAHCPAKEIEGNPVFDLLRLVIWPRLALLHKDAPARFEIHRPEKFGGSKIYIGFDAVEAEYRSGALHPLDLKNGVADSLALLLQPVRDHFAKHPDNWQFVQALRRTR